MIPFPFTLSNSEYEFFYFQAVSAPVENTTSMIRGSSSCSRDCGRGHGQGRVHESQLSEDEFRGTSLNQSTATSDNGQRNWQKTFSKKDIPFYSDSRTFRQSTDNLTVQCANAPGDVVLQGPGRHTPPISRLFGRHFPLIPHFAEGAESVPSTKNLETGKYKDTQIVTCCEKCNPFV